MASLLAGEKVSQWLFTQTYLSPDLRVQVKVEPMDLECAIPFDVVVDTTTTVMVCEAVFLKLDGDISCKDE
jgi:hypothetical protein